MKLDIEIIAREVVIPSSPTPSHINKHILSSLDQTLPHVLMSRVFFYPANYNDNNPNLIPSNSEISKQLKTSLSQTITLFYPLAGRLVGNSYVNCNDEGVTYIEAKANDDVKLLDVIASDPSAEELNKFFPDCYDGTDICMVVQATFFCCGGLAIGIGISHKIADAFSYFMFVNSWAAISRCGDVPNNIQSPIFEGATVFPPKRDVVEFKLSEEKENKVDVVRKRFVFTAQKISDLREKYTSKDVRPTRIEALSTFIWTRFMVASGAKDDTSKVNVLLFPVDIRTRIVPSLSEYHFGNLILLPSTMGLSLVNDKEDAAGYGIVKKIRGAIREIDGDYIAKKIQEEANHLDTVVEKQVSKGEEVNVFAFSSLCRLPLYKADFGWGIPKWVVLGKVRQSHVVYFTATSSGDGIEIWVNLNKEDMIKFKEDKELLDYVSCGDI